MAHSFPIAVGGVARLRKEYGLYGLFNDHEFYIKYESSPFGGVGARFCPF